jgi:hypothetical protein
MRRRAIAAAGAATLGAATAVVALVAGTSVGFAETTTSSAYGIEAVGPIPIEPTPYVESTDGSTKTTEAFQMPDNPLVKLGLANLSAGDQEASSELLRVALLPGAALPEELAPLQDALDQLAAALEPLCAAEPPVDQLPENPITDALPEELLDALDPNQLCEGLEGGLPALLSLDAVEVFCEGDQGGVKLVDLAVFGQKAPDFPEPEPNTAIIPENPLITVTANKQETLEDGSFSVTGLEINLGDGAQIIRLSNATCGGTKDDDNPPTATPPPPVTTGLPVTG